MVDVGQNGKGHRGPVRYGKAAPERSDKDAPDQEQLGIEIDNALERPQEGQPGERGKGAARREKA